MITAKMLCMSITNHGAQACGKVSEQVKLVPVYTEDTTSPNYTWSKATPAGTLELTITNRGAFDKFKAGKEYLITVEEA